MSRIYIDTLINEIFPELKEEYDFDVYYDEWEDSIIIRSVPWWHGSKYWSTDSLVELYKVISTVYEGRCSLDELGRAVRSWGTQHNRVHPIKQYLESVTWDKIPRLDTLIIKYLGADDTQLNREMTRKALTAAVARIYQPGIKFDSMLVLQGPQRIGKSTFVKKMGMEWANDSITSVETKDVYLQIKKSWLIELAELTALKPKALNNFKQILSSPVDLIREPYDKEPVYRPRRSIFIGTTNNNNFLLDTTGNRRFWAIKVTGNTNNSIFNLTQFEVDQIWAEAKHRYDSHEPLYLAEKYEKELSASLIEHCDENPYIGAIEEFLSRKLPENWDTLSIPQRIVWLDSGEIGTVTRTQVCVSEIWQECLKQDITKRKRSDSDLIVQALKSIKWTRVPSTHHIPQYGTQGTFTKSN